MKNIRNKDLHIRVSELEKKVIKDKAELLGLSITDYVIDCCIFSGVTDKFMKDLCVHSEKGSKMP